MRATTTYDASLSRQYEVILNKRSTFSWLATILEEYAIRSLPPERDIAILDVACGVGSFCWRAHDLGYRDVVGVDASFSQVQACLGRADSLPAGLSFYQEDAKGLGLREEFIGRFDVVSASWLYDTANDEHELYAMGSGVRRCLKIGGRHLAIDLNFDVQASDPSDLDEFGIRLMPDKPQGYRPANAERIKAHVQTCGEFFATDVTFFDEETYTRMLSECGFGQVTFRRPQTWDLADCLSNPDDLARFQKYVATNPEMMAFSTITV